MMIFVKDQKGESLVETLIAILIFTLASIAMFTMVTTAARLNREAKDADEAFQRQLTAVESAETPSATGTVTMKLSGTSETVTVDVNIYGGSVDESGARNLYSYFRKP